MRILILVTLVFGFAFARANEEDFAKHKAQILTHIDGKIAKFQEHKTCVAAAANKEALEKCHEEMEAWHRNEMKENLKRKKEHLKNKLDKIEDKLEGKIKKPEND